MSDLAVIFNTERFYGRRWQQTDLETIYEVYADEEGARWVGDGTPITHDECEAWLDVTFANYQKRGYGMFTIVTAGTDEIVGFCGLVHPDQQETAEIKYAFKKQHWGKGFASEVVPTMLGYGHSVHGLHKIIATVAIENLASQRVLQKSGMVHTDTYDEADSQTLVYEWRSR